ncbi:MAG: hypothetical protein CVU39_06250 [Chloroflexi bacterium HGW-Chloroflexi-10]|nr:MAG: hypothetical protein CVU39_06250 [Chloroflexi bacterium HGW-Chloroflexi-10]
MDILEEFAEYISKGYLIAIMPITRVIVDVEYVAFPHGVTFYPPSYVQLDNLGYIPNKSDSTSLAEVVSAASGVTLESFDEHPLVVFPCMFRWEEFRTDNFRNHMKFLRTMSQYVDDTLDVVRYYQCEINNFHPLPGQAGTLNSNIMMSAALLFNPKIHESRIIAGDAFANRITRGLGLPLESVDKNLFPKSGEVGKIVKHALSLYSSLMESSNLTVKFTQCMSLIEFLAFPDEYKKFSDVSKIISRYVAKNAKEYQDLLERFNDLTGRKDPETNEIIGLRTRIVHLGDKIETILPDDALNMLFLDLQIYIKAVIDHMIQYSDLSWDEYLDLRNQLTPFTTKG